MLYDLSLCHPSKRKTIPLSRKQTTEEWLQEKIDEKNIRFRYFITLTFNKAQKEIIGQYLENQHIKRVILDFFYPNRKPKNRIRVWFFCEKHLSGELHLHLLLEGMNGIQFLSNNNRRVQISKKTLFDIIARDFTMDDVITETLTNHLQTHIRRLGKSKQSVDMRGFGNLKKRIKYVNKSLKSYNFNNWEHIDFQNSDL